MVSIEAVPRPLLQIVDGLLPREALLDRVPLQVVAAGQAQVSYVDWLVYLFPYTIVYSFALYLLTIWALARFGITL